MAKVGTELHYSAGEKIVLKAGSEMTLEAGGSFIKLDPSGIYINGIKVMINSGGSPGTGTAAAPELPDDSKGTKKEKEGFVTKAEGLAYERQIATLREALDAPFSEICEETLQE